MCQAVHEHGATTYASLSVLSDQLVQRASMDRVVTISINREHEAVVVKEPGPPPGGGRTVMAYASQAREKLPKYHRKYPAYPWRSH